MIIFIVLQIFILLIANMCLPVVYTLFGYQVSLGAFIYPFSTMIFDYYVFLYDVRTVKRWLHWLMPFVILVTLFIDTSIAIASSVVYYISQRIDLLILRSLLRCYPKRFIWCSYISTVFAQAFDTYLFYMLIANLTHEPQLTSPIMLASTDFFVKCVSQLFGLFLLKRLVRDS